MLSIIALVSTILSIFIWLIIASAILSWLIAFNVVNRQNQFVYTIADFLYKITEPLLRPIRRFIPDLGGIDISPVILILLLMFIQNLIAEYLVPAVQ